MLGFACLLSVVACSTFRVDGVGSASTALYEEHSLAAKMRSSSLFNATRVVATSPRGILTVDTGFEWNGFMAAIHLAFTRHHGLTLSPEKLLVVILQGVAIHQTSQGATHDVQLTLRYDGLISETPLAGWEFILNFFKTQVGDTIPRPLYALLKKPFSTSTYASIAISTFTILPPSGAPSDAALATACAIPEITLDGATHDWVDLKARTALLLERLDGLQAWKATLLPILDEFIRASQGMPTHGFWQNMYALSGDEVRGWVTGLFPYIHVEDGFERNTCAHGRLAFCGGLPHALFPAGFVRTPFTWKYLDRAFDLEVVAGFLGVERADAGIQPGLAWVVRYRN